MNWEKHGYIFFALLKTKQIVVKINEKNELKYFVTKCIHVSSCRAVNN